MGFIGRAWRLGAGSTWPMNRRKLSKLEMGAKGVAEL